MTTQYTQFSMRARVASQVANTLAQVVRESASGQAARVSLASSPALNHDSGRITAAATRCHQNGAYPTGSSPRTSERRQFQKP